MDVFPGKYTTISIEYNSKGRKFMAQIILNGESTDLAEGETLGRLLASRQPGARNIIVEWNGKILTEKDPLATFELKDGDTVDLFSMVGGG